MHTRRYTKLIIIVALLLPGIAFAANLFSQSGFLTAASNQYFSATQASSILPSGNFTIEGWFYFTTHDTTGEVALFQSGNDGGVDSKNWQIYYCSSATCGGSNSLYVDICSSGGCGTEKVGTFVWSPSANTWYHVAIVYDTSGSVSFYTGTTSGGDSQVGSAVTGFPTTVRVNTTSPFKIGGYTSGAGQSVAITFDGYVNLARVWTTNNNLTTINANNCSILASGTTNMGGQWTLDNTLNDSSGNSNTLTAVNSATFSSAQVAPCTAAAATATPLITALVHAFGW